MKYRVPAIIFEVTQECNLTCQYCYNHWRRENSVLKKTNFRETVHTLKKLFRSVDFDHITFTGGEPFLAEGLAEIVLMCRLKGKSVNIISNGTIAQKSDYEILGKLGVSLFEFPLLADNPDDHDSLTNHANSFNRVIESIKTVRDLNSEVCVVFVITRQNINRLEQTLHLAENLGVSRFMLARFNIGGRGIKNIQNLLPSLPDIHQAFKTAQDFARIGKIRISANVCLPDCLVNPSSYPLIPISSCGLDAAKRPITIDFSGDVRLCNHSPHVMGNIHSDSISSIFQSGYIQNWGSACPEYCTDCSEWSKCGGGCRAASEQMGYSVSHEDPFIKLIKGVL